MIWRKAIVKTLLDPIAAILWYFILPVMVLGAVHKSAESIACAFMVLVIIAAFAAGTVLNKNI